jgi:hypothetical protein
LIRTTAEYKLTEMTDVVKSILRGRYKEKAAEWRQLARQIHVNIGGLSVVLCEYSYFFVGPSRS